MIPHTAPPSTLSEPLLVDLVSPNAHFIETGIGDGRGVELALKYFVRSRIHTCDTDEHKVNALRESFPGVDVQHARSVDFLSRINFLTPRSHSIFWLDAHTEGDVPIVEELELIFSKFFTFRTYILIDDVHNMLFGNSWQVDNVWLNLSKFLTQVPQLSWTFHPNAFGQPGSILLIEHE